MIKLVKLRFVYYMFQVSVKRPIGPLVARCTVLIVELKECTKQLMIFV